MGSNATPFRPGQRNGSGDVDAAFLTIFSGEVLTEFKTKNVMLDKALIRRIESGSGAQFPRVGKVTASYHTPGVELVGQAVLANDITIKIDGEIAADVFIDSLEEAMASGDYRQPLTEEMGARLSNIADQNLIKECIKGARMDAIVTGGKGGIQIVNDKLIAASTPVAGEQKDAILAALRQAKAKLDKNNVPENDRYVVMGPDEFNYLLEDTVITSQLYGGPVSIVTGNPTGKLYGFSVLVSNQIPHTDETLTDTKHGADFSKTVFIAFQKSALGTVQKWNIITEMERQINRLGWFAVSHMAMGHGVLRPEACVEFCLNELSYPEE